MLWPPSAPISEAIRPCDQAALDVGAGGREGEVTGIPGGHGVHRRRPAPGWRVTAASPCRVAGTNTDQNWAPTPPARRRGRSVWVGHPAREMSSRSQS